ncbi:MAG: hypothetical protein ABSF21_00505 [Dehalococcoidia bacterium]
MDFDIWHLAKEIATPRQVGARNDSTDGLLTPKMATIYCYLIGMFKNVIVGHLLFLSLRGPIYRAEAISVGPLRVGIATLPLRFAQGFGSPQ